MFEAYFRNHPRWLAGRSPRPPKDGRAPCHTLTTPVSAARDERWTDRLLATQLNSCRWELNVHITDIENRPNCTVGHNRPANGFISSSQHTTMHAASMHLTPFSVFISRRSYVGVHEMYFRILYAWRPWKGKLHLKHICYTAMTISLKWQSFRFLGAIKTQ